MIIFSLVFQQYYTVRLIFLPCVFPPILNAKLLSNEQKKILLFLMWSLLFFNMHESKLHQKNHHFNLSTTTHMIILPMIPLLFVIDNWQLFFNKIRRTCYFEWMLPKSASEILSFFRANTYYYTSHQKRFKEFPKFWSDCVFTLLIL